MKTRNESGGLALKRQAISSNNIQRNQRVEHWLGKSAGEKVAFTLCYGSQNRTPGTPVHPNATAYNMEPS